jgi:hypothetical protein
MRQFLIDDLSAEESANLDTYMKKALKQGAMEGLFWLYLPEDLLAEKQDGHEECGPFLFGIELTRNKLIAEFLVRNQSNLHCSCIGYATKAQRDFLLDFIDTMLEAECIYA